MTSHVKVLCFGDVVGRPGRVAIQQGVAELRKLHQADLVIVNGENAAGGLGITPQIAQEFRNQGVDVVTLGDHTFQRKEIRAFLIAQKSWIIRPANYPSGAPGNGWALWGTPSGVSVGILNLLGRVFIQSPLDCPFQVVETILAGPLKDVSIIICDMHAEATSEKAALARYLDGRVSLVFGTHTHVPTADEQLLPGGTAFVSDIGMCGSLDSVIGMDSKVAVGRFVNGLPQAYEVASGIPVLQGIVCEIDLSSGKATRIERVRWQGSSVEKG